MNNFEMTKRMYAGKRAILVARASTLQQEVSTRDQLEDMRRFASEWDIRVAEELKFEGVSASKSWKRDDLNRIRHRKSWQNDFEIVIWYDPSRMTRGGVAHGYALLHELKSLGLRCAFSAQPQFNGPDGEIFLSLAFAQARHYVTDLAQKMSRGVLSAIEAKRMTGVTTSWYGTDRLYLMEDGTPRHIVRTIFDGTQIVFHPEIETDEAESVVGITTGKIIERFAGSNGQQMNRYRKQRRDTVEVIPGDPKHVGIVHHMFTRKLIDNWGYVRIMDELNHNHIMSPKGSKWSLGTVTGLFEHSIYVGYYYKHQMRGGLFFNQTKEGPKQVHHDDPEVEAGTKAPKLKWTERSEWVRIEQIHMATFFQSPLKERAEEFIEKRLHRRRRGIRPNKDRHTHSSFFLKYILKTAGEQRPMTGKKIGKYRYYAPANWRNERGLQQTRGKSVQADKIELVVKNALQECLNDSKHLRRLLVADAKSESELRNEIESRIKSLVKEKESLEFKAKFIVENIETYEEELASEMLQENRAKRYELDERIQKIKSNASTTIGKSHASIDDVVAKLRAVTEMLETGPNAAIRRLLATFVSKAEIDLNTRRLDIEFRLPSWVRYSPEKLCLDSGERSYTGVEAKFDNSIFLKRLRFDWFGSNRGRYVQINVIDDPASQNQPIEADSRHVHPQEPPAA